jgi:prepilin-type processing-associated H-X9-DG protein/prepilin-type N-terminal cleavage/methylation domain-containing protein
VALARAGGAGFTLVELLVVIGIIAVLMGILLPVVSKARGQGLTVRCASNLRQFGQGWTMYANSYGGTAAPMRLPEQGNPVQDLGQGPHYRPRWQDLLGAQMKSYAFATAPQSTAEDGKPIENELFICPAQPEWRNARNYTYGYNFQFLGNPRHNSKNQFINYPVRASRLRGAETVMAADSMGTAAGKAKASRRAYKADGLGELFALGNHGYTIDPPRLTAKCDYSEDNSRTPVDRSAPDPRHSKKANVVFCDGHVELMALEDMGYIVRPDGSVAADDPSAHNKLFSGTGRDDDPPAVEP